LENTSEAHARAHFGDAICDLEEKLPALAKIWPFPDYQKTIERIIKSGGMEPPRSVDTEKVYAKLAASSLVEVDALRVGLLTGVGKFKSTKESFIQFSNVVKKTFTNLTSYSRLSVKTKLKDIAIDMGKRSGAYTAAVRTNIVPSVLAADDADRAKIMQYTLVFVLKEIQKEIHVESEANPDNDNNNRTSNNNGAQDKAQKNDETEVIVSMEYLDLLFNLLKYVVTAHRFDIEGLEDSIESDNDSDDEDQLC